MKASIVLIGLVFLLACCVVPAALASELAIYSGPSNPGWIAQPAVGQVRDVIMNDASMKGIFDSITDFGDGDEVGDDSPLALWTKAHTGNGQQDVIVTASGTTPSALYQFPNADPDGSNVENFIEDGNVVINIADWIFYMSYEGGVRSADNGANGAANIFDVPGLSFGDQGGMMEPTEDGMKYIPVLEEFDSARPWHLGQLEGTDWEVTIFAGDGGDSADPAVAVHQEYGGIIAAMWQDDAPIWPGDDPRGIGVVQFIANWLTENGEIGTLNVDPRDKMATTWGQVRAYGQ